MAIPPHLEMIRKCYRCYARRGSPTPPGPERARLKNGFTYRGEYFFAGYRHEGASRELMLANVKFFPYKAQTIEDTGSAPKLYDYVLLDLENCESLEFLLTSG